jgi:magnesium-transporting ATPase (P-type)
MSDQPPLVPPGPAYEPPQGYAAPPVWPSYGTPGLPPEPRPDPAEQVRLGAIDLGVIAAWFLVAGLIGALIWWQVTPLAEYTRTSNNGVLDEQQLGKQFATDGWFFTIALAGGLLSGIILALWRGRDPILTVVLLALGGVFATAVMMQAGLLFGPANPRDVLKTVAVGAKVPLQLKTSAGTVWIAWSMGAMFGALGSLWLGSDGSRPDPRPQQRPPG